MVGDKHPFEYQKPTEAQTEAMKAMNDSFKAAYEALLVYAPGSAERTIAIRKLQEVRMWANVAVLFGEAK